MSTGTEASLRGLHAVNDEIVWACGSAGTVLRSDSRGERWESCGPARYSELEFRSIHAWDARTACIASAGSPAVVLRTVDAGESWIEVFRHNSESAFFDALRFIDAKHGLAFSDPVDGRLLLVETSDAGDSWQGIAPELIPLAETGEAGFAASNSGMCWLRDGSVLIGTGGRTADDSRVFVRRAGSKEWVVIKVPLPSSPTEGIFSITEARRENLLVAVGGNYLPNEESLGTAVISRDGGTSWQRPAAPPSAYRSSVIAGPVGWPAFVATGPSGSDFSMDGEQWTAFSETGFHVLASGTKTVFAAGSDGRFGVLESPD